MVIHGEFDYSKYLASKNIYGNISSYQVKKIGINKGNIILKYIYVFRESISRRIDRELHGQNSALLKGMIYGDTKDLDEKVKKDFEDIGISHLTAVSGSNVSTLVVIFTILLSKIGFKKWTLDILLLIFIAIFCVISALELSIVRATLMTSILVISKLLKKRISVYTILLVTITTIVIVNPMAIFNVGFVLSFAATLSIVMFVVPIQDFLDKILKKVVKNKVVFKIAKYITVPLGVTISANILIFPITIYFFGKFPLIFLVSNVIASYLETGIRIIGVIAIILMKVPTLSTILFQISGALCSILIYISNILEKVSMIVYFRQPTFIFLLIYYLMFFCIYIKIEIKRIASNKSNQNLKEQSLILYKIYNLINVFEEKVKKISIEKLLSILLLIYISAFKIYNIYFDNYIYFMNVGQGDMSAIKTRDSFGLIDIGSTRKGLASSILISFMKNKNIKEIDYIIISHMHTDHINGIIEILQSYKVGMVVYSYPSNIKSIEYLNILNYLENKKIKTIMVQSGDNISVGKDLNINILLAGQGKIVDKDMENANSIILEVASNSKRVMFMGDSTKASEKILIQRLDNTTESEKYNIKYNGLKVGHHGSNTSTSEDLLKKIDFKFGVISSEKEKFGHPSEDVLELLKKYRVNQYITEKEGAIKYSLN